MNNELRKAFSFLILLAPVLKASGQILLCNICGCLNCTFADAAATVDFVYQDQPQRFNCIDLQERVENPTIISTSYCREELWKLAFAPCKCYHVDNPEDLLSDIEGKLHPMKSR